VANKMTEEIRENDRVTIYTRFLTPEERSRRIKEAGAALGFHTIQKMAEACDMGWQQMKNTMTRENVSVRSLMRVAYVFGVSMAYLTER